MFSCGVSTGLPSRQPPLMSPVSRPSWARIGGKGMGGKFMGGIRVGRDSHGRWPLTTPGMISLGLMLGPGKVPCWHTGLTVGNPWTTFSGELSKCQFMGGDSIPLGWMVTSG